MKNELFSIGEAAKLKQVSAKSLRYYETIGILKPAYVDPSSGYRYYSPNQMIDLDVILTCIELGIPLKSLTDHKTNRGSLNLKELLISGRDTALANIRRAEDSLMRINSCIDEITEQEILRHKDAPYTRCLAKRHIFISPLEGKKILSEIVHKSDGGAIPDSRRIWRNPSLLSGLYHCLIRKRAED